MKSIFFAAFAVTFLAVSALRADVLLTNLPGDLVIGSSLTGVAHKAIGLTIGSQAYSFESLAIYARTDTAALLVTGGIYNDDGGSPGNLLLGFNAASVMPSETFSEYGLSATAPFVLEANTTYWFVVNPVSDQPTDIFRWARLDPNAAPTPKSGIQYLGYLGTSEGDATWSSSATYNAVTITGSPVPEPAMTGLLAFGAGVVLFSCRGRRSR